MIWCKIMEQAGLCYVSEINSQYASSTIPLSFLIRKKPLSLLIRFTSMGTECSISTKGFKLNPVYKYKHELYKIFLYTSFVVLTRICEKVCLMARTT